MLTDCFQMLLQHAVSMTCTQRNQQGFVSAHALWWHMKLLKGILRLSHRDAGVQITDLL